MVTVAACQVPIDINDSGETLRIVREAVAEAAGRGARLVVLPELTLCGSIFRDVAEATARAEPASGPSVGLFRALSAEHEIVVVAGFCEESGLDRPYNSAVVADRAGAERGRRWVGGSVICDVEGDRVAGPEFGVATVLSADVDLDLALDKRISTRNHVFDDRRTDLY